MKGRGSTSTTAREPRRDDATDLRIDPAGYARGVRQVHSPNCDARPPGTAITLAVIHGISLPPGRFGGGDVERLFTNTLDTSAHPFYGSLAGLRVSAHFFVRRDGSIVQFVACSARAWHAGVSAWEERARCNDYSIGIEVEGADSIAYEDGQYQCLARLLRALRRRYPLTAAVGHSDVAPGRKTDPGPAFDWPRLARLVRARLLHRDRDGRLPGSPAAVV